MQYFSDRTFSCTALLLATMAFDGFSATSLSDDQPLTGPTADVPAPASQRNKENGDSNNGNNGSGEGAKGTKVSRKRTKTGCLSANSLPPIS